MSVVDVLRIQSTNSCFDVPMTRVRPVFKLLLQGFIEVRLEGPRDAAEWGVEVAMDAPTGKLMKILAACGMRPRNPTGTWMDRLKPRLQRELKEKFRDFIDRGVLESRSVPFTPNMRVKATIIVALRKWEQDEESEVESSISDSDSDPASDA